MIKAKIIALSHVTKKILWFHRLCHDFHIFDDQKSSITPSISMINSDSESALKVIKNPVFHACIKHFDMHHHFIKNIVAKDELSMRYIPGNENPVDIFTKSLDRSKHAIALDLLHMT